MLALGELNVRKQDAVEVSSIGLSQRVSRHFVTAQSQLYCSLLSSEKFTQFSIFVRIACIISMKIC